MGKFRREPNSTFAFLAVLWPINLKFCLQVELDIKERVKAGNFHSKKGKAHAGAEPATSRPARKSANHLATRTVIEPEKKLPYKEPRHKKTEIRENS